MNGLITALQTLTILPIHRQSGDRFSQSLGWFPVVGFLLGSLFALLAWSGQTFSAPVVSALLVLAGVVITRGFHLDGLADTADGFGGGHARERALEIMKDPNTGAFGAAAITLSLLLKWVAFTEIIHLQSYAFIVPAFTLSRGLLVEQMLRLPYARSTGTAEVFVKGAKPWHRTLSLVLCGCVTLLFIPFPFSLLAFTLAWMASFCFARYCQKRVGGITGDLLGATSEGIEILMLLLPSFLIHL